MRADVLYEFANRYEDTLPSSVTRSKTRSQRRYTAIFT